MNRKKKEPKPVYTKLYSYWNALYMAFYSSHLYMDVYRCWRGYGLLYMLLLISIASIPFSIRVLTDLNQYFDEQIISPIQQIPSLYVQDGNILLDKPMPYFIKNKIGKVAIIIDTTGTITEINKSYPELFILITKDKLYFRPLNDVQSILNKQEKSTIDNVEVESVDHIDNGVFEGKKWLKVSGVLNLKWMIDTMLFPSLASFFYTLCLGFMLPLSLLGKVFAKVIFKQELTFKDACRLSMVASTALVFVFFGLLTMHIYIKGLGILCVGLFAAYFSYAMLAVRRDRKKMVLA